MSMAVDLDSGQLSRHKRCPVGTDGARRARARPAQRAPSVPTGQRLRVGATLPAEVHVSCYEHGGGFGQWPAEPP